MSAPASSTSTSTATRIVIAGAGPAAQALVAQLDRARFTGTVTVLSNRDDTPEELLELAMLPQVSVRFGQPASHIDPANRTVATADGMEFAYDHLVIATGSAPVAGPVDGAAQCLNYATIDDAPRVAKGVQKVARELGRRPVGILVGTGAAAGQAEAVLRAKGVRPIRTTARPAAIIPAVVSGTSARQAASAVVFEDGSSMTGDLVVMAEERVSRDGLAASAGLQTAPGGGIVISRDYRTSVQGIWAIGDAAAFDGVRLGLLVAAASAAGACATQLLSAAAEAPALQAA
ncbi:MULTISPECIES: FAD-dependent oxidoreductase [Pseudarthrobacter]|uniref:NAD(P)H-nitrite reductase large subunit n=1 Tax=Pseudarthrobacter niigatensis TaxID=369935 RepID=A0AAJ1WFQ3_9MICC|nr:MULTISPECIES: FAD-dependent oxidoreductase [Pseudarthrobacter]MDQ0146247.1 NAD(P)H-nitrite reductase large subunit [Pseudarthrobacter niigatensis]MDQ0264797.1 NAD(P)H-nitrite reductase large subunit [Pseudarthrobacter niigatensis]QDG64245.1 pyridine nucleotide-disulfide oxidoreductase [Pseudarthrobacter sp. NIBRBAC000502771]QDG87697.1 pyridine nucleotide-disulfide oxidoreductase [Pseudarthrobacter sp. NIBRBAC000502770]